MSMDTELSPSSPSADGTRDQEASGEDGKQVEEKEGVKEEESEPSAECKEKVGDGKTPPGESSSEEDVSCDSESLELQLSTVAAADSSLLHIDESDDECSILKENGLENGDASAVKDLSSPHKVCVLSSTQLRADDVTLCPLQDVPARIQTSSPDAKNTTV